MSLRSNYLTVPALDIIGSQTESISYSNISIDIIMSQKDETIPYPQILVPGVLDEVLMQDEPHTLPINSDYHDNFGEEQIEVPVPSYARREKQVAKPKTRKDVVDAAKTGFCSSSDEDSDEKIPVGETPDEKKARENKLRVKVTKIDTSLNLLDKHKPSDIIPTVCAPYNIWARRFRSVLKTMGFANEDLKLSIITKTFMPCILPKLPPEMHAVLEKRSLFGVLSYLEGYDEGHRRIIDQMRQVTTIKVKPTMAFTKFLTDLKNSYTGSDPDVNDELFVQLAWEMVLDRLPTGLRNQYPLNVMTMCPDRDEMKKLDILWMRFVKNQPSKIDTSTTDKIDNVAVTPLPVQNVPNTQSRPAQRGNFRGRGQNFQQNFQQPNQFNTGFTNFSYRGNFRGNFVPRGNFRGANFNQRWNNFQPRGNWFPRGNFRPRGQNMQFGYNFPNRGNFRGGFQQRGRGFPTGPRFNVIAPNANLPPPNVNFPNLSTPIQNPSMPLQSENVQQMCFYHTRFGNLARNCVPGCKFYSTGQTQSLN